MSLLHWKYADQVREGSIFRYSSQLETLPTVNIQGDSLRNPWRTQSGFVITQWNREFPFRDTSTGAVKNFSIPSGTYTGSGLASVLESKLNLIGNYSDHDASYNSTTGKFVIKRTGGGGIFRLLFSTVIYWPNTAAVILGFGNRTDYTGTKTHSSTSFGNEHEVIISFTSTQTVNSLIIDRHNLASGTVMHFRGTRSTATVFSGGFNSSTSIVKSSTITYTANQISIEFTATSLKHIQLHWYDRSQAYSQIGKVWASTYFSPIYQENNWMTWRRKTTDPRSSNKVSEAGVTFFNKRNKVDEYEIGIDPLDPYYNSSTKTGFENLLNSVETSKPFYVSFNTASNTVFGYIANKNWEFKRLKNTPVLMLGTISFRQQL